MMNTEMIEFKTCHSYGRRDYLHPTSSNVLSLLLDLRQELSAEIGNGWATEGKGPGKNSLFL